MISEIQFDIEKTKAETSMYELANFNRRTDAIDFIDFHIIDRIEGMIQEVGGNSELIKLGISAKKLKSRLENIHSKMFRQLERQIINSKYKRFVLRNIIEGFLRDFISDDELSDAVGYDNLDIFLNRLLSTNNIAEERKKLEPGMVFYQKTPGRISLN